MGFGSYSSASYARTTGAKIASGTTFSYDSTARSTGTYAAHETLDPTKKNADGKLIRESRDSVEHPNSVPIVVGFDATGSMGSVPRVVQQKLSGLFGLLTRKGYVEDPQVSISAYGDVDTDRVPLQISQFESSNAVDDNLDNLFLEGNGGGNMKESASVLWYYLNNHVETDAWQKRGKKGYLFVIADEVSGGLTPEQVKRFIGSDEPVGDLSVTGIANELKKKWDVYILLIDNSSAKMQGSENFYGNLFGKDHVLIIENPETISETIGAALGRLENGDLDEDDLIDDLVAIGATKTDALAAAKSVAKIGGGGRGTLAKGNVNLAVDDDDAVIF